MKKNVTGYNQKSKNIANSRMNPVRSHSRYIHLKLLRKNVERLIYEHLKNGDNLILADMGCGEIPYESLMKPHIVVLDEPTNHLDIESREALVHALNDFSGAVIIVSHDVHLVEMIADRLWLVKSGKVTQYDGDINDYRKNLLSDRNNKPKIKNVTTPLKRKDEDNNLVVSITSKIKNCEKKIELLLKKKSEAQKMISGSVGINLQSYQINQIKNKLDKISKEIEEEEKHWLALQE